MKRISNLCLPAMLSLGMALGACSSSQQDEEALQAEGETEQEEAEAEQEADENASESDELAGLEELMEDADTASETVEQSAPLTTPADVNRVVRYVREAGATAFSNADQGQNLGVFPQGTRLLVVEEGDWSRIGDGMFVKSTELSTKPVPRAKKNAVWSHPAH